MLAVVIPYYKLTFFDTTLQSLANQTDKRFKVYIGDDASPEDPAVLLEKYRGKFDFVYIRFEGNLGGISLVKQWEHCIALTDDEEWIMILGDDDYLGINAIKEFYKSYNQIRENNINVIRYATQSILNGVFSPMFIHCKFEKSIDFIFRKLKGETRSSLSEYIFNKEKLFQIKFKELPLAWHSDELAILEVSDFSTVYTINQAVIYINVSELSISGSGNKYNMLKNEATIIFFKTLIDNYKVKFSKNQLSDLVRLLSESYFKSPGLNLFFQIASYHLKYTSLSEFSKFCKKQSKREIKKILS